MILYKYRSLADFEFVLDIILNQRLHCSAYDELNDPFEGIFLTTLYIKPYLPLNVNKNIEDHIFNSKNKIRICSLSSSISDVRMWSHYAAGHRGIAFEIDFSEVVSNIYMVNYSDKLPSFGSTILTGPNPHEVLSHKTKHWDYEAEYRVIQENEFFDISNRIKRIYLGSRISKNHFDLLIKIIPDEIPIYTTRINKDNITVEIGENVRK